MGGIAGTATKVASSLNPLSVGLDVAGDVANLAFQYWALQEQKKENANLNRISLGEAAKDRKMRAAEFKESMAEQKKVNRFNQAMTISNNMQAALRRNPEAATRLMNIQQTRRA
jgi:hypothetical protein